MCSFSTQPGTGYCLSDAGRVSWFEEGLTNPGAEMVGRPILAGDYCVWNTKRQTNLVKLGPNAKSSELVSDHQRSKPPLLSFDGIDLFAIWPTGIDRYRNGSYEAAPEKIADWSAAPRKNIEPLGSQYVLRKGEPSNVINEIETGRLVGGFVPSPRSPLPLRLQFLSDLDEEDDESTGTAEVENLSVKFRPGGATVKLKFTKPFSTKLAPFRHQPELLRTRRFPPQR